MKPNSKEKKKIINGNKKATNLLKYGQGRRGRVEKRVEYVRHNLFDIICSP